MAPRTTITTATTMQAMQVTATTTATTATTAPAPPALARQTHADTRDKRDDTPAEPQEDQALAAMATPLLVWWSPPVAVPTPPAPPLNATAAAPAGAIVPATRTPAMATATATGAPVAAPKPAFNPVQETPAPACDDGSVAPPVTPVLMAVAPAPAPTWLAPVATLALSGPGPAWQQPLKEALGDQLQLQLSRSGDHATIRLDPPDLGRIDIAIKQINGTLQVSLAASNNEVLRQLHGIGDSLRQNLAQPGAGEVAVVISALTGGAASRNAALAADADGASRQRQPAPQPQRDDRPGRALDETTDGEGPAPPRFAFQRPPSNKR